MDARDRVFAEFKCNICEKTTEIDVTGRRSTFDFGRERKCPQCGLTNPQDKEQNLKAMLDKLMEDKSGIEIQIDKIERELNELKHNEVTN